jgi:hypothetical protein
MSGLISIGIPVAVGLLISYGVRPRRWRTGLGALLIVASLIGTYLLPLAPEDFQFIYVASWATGLDLVLNRNRYAAGDG